MANLCLPKENRDKLKAALKQGDITLERLYDMDSAQRNTIFKQFVGDDFASFVNAKFEQAMLSNQKKALVNWVKRTTSHRDPIRRDMLKRVERVKKVLTPDEQRGFLKDLADEKVGLTVTEEEAETILRLKKDVDSMKSKWDPTKAEADLAQNPTSRTAGWASEDDRLAYGFALDDFKTYIGELKLAAEKLSTRERLKPANWGQSVRDIAGATKSMVATLDNSFIGRQGIKVLLDGKYSIWGRTLVSSLKSFGQELFAKSPGFFKSRDDAVMRAIRADIWSRPNALNGKYVAAKNGYGLGVIGEEAFPSPLPERVPFLGRLFKASETAFNGSALRMRSDLADAVIAQAEKNGLDMLDEVQASAHGRIVSSMTGRGDIRKVSSKESTDWGNVLFFSIRFLKSNWDTLTAHQFDRTMTPEAKRLAAMSLLRIVGSLGAVLTVSKMLDPESVDFDPRKGKFGQICKGNHCYDITGGLGGLVTFASRVIPTYHDGEWGSWTYSKNTRKWKKMSDAGFGQQTTLDYIESFFEGKFSPAAGAVRDILRGQNFEGQKPTFFNTTIGLVTPISFEMFLEEMHQGNDDILAAMLAEVFGISPRSNISGGYGRKWDELREKEDVKTYNEALKTVSENFQTRAKKLESTLRFERMDNEEKSKALDKIRREETDKVLKRFGID